MTHHQVDRAEGAERDHHRRDGDDADEHTEPVRPQRPGTDDEEQRRGERAEDLPGEDDARLPAEDPPLRRGRDAAHGVPARARGRGAAGCWGRGLAAMLPTEATPMAIQVRPSTASGFHTTSVTE